MLDGAVAGADNEREQRGEGTVRLIPATAIVVGNMVGVGVFVSLGFQLVGIQSGFVLMLLWAVGGLCALCGAVCYSELAAALPRSGGEYHMLSQVFHPSLGFVAGWVSVTAGFAAPVAVAAMSFGDYFAGAFDFGKGGVIPTILVALVTLLHLFQIGVGSGFQSIATALKVGVILVLIGGAFILGDRQPEVSFVPAQGDWKQLTSRDFAISLVFVMYAYAGWNAAAYIIDEVKNPVWTVPRALVGGTALVILLYLGVNMGFLYSTPAEAMSGQPEAGVIAAKSIFGETGGKWMSGLICFGLISAVSAMTWAGPRVLQRMGQDYAILRWFGRTNSNNVPAVAVVTQGVLVCLLIWTQSPKDVLTYVGTLLTLVSALTVAGVFWLRWTRPDLHRPIRAWGYPFSPLFFLVVSGWMLCFVIIDEWKQALVGAATVSVALILYALNERMKQESS